MASIIMQYSYSLDSSSYSPKNDNGITICAQILAKNSCYPILRASVRICVLVRLRELGAQAIQ